VSTLLPHPVGRRAWRGIGVVATLLLAGCLSSTPPYTMPSVPLADPAFQRTVEVNTRAPVVGGNKIALLVNGDEYFPPMLSAIRSAKTTITFEQYVYEKAGIAEEFSQALAERCRAGVRVSLLLDSAGAFGIPAEYVTLMRTSGCHVAFFRPLRPWQISRSNHRSHRRALVVDGRIAFTGGFGVSEKWTGDGRTPENWRDTVVRVEGPVVQQIQASFAQNWRETTGMVLGAAYVPAKPSVGTVSAQAVVSSPIGESYDTYLLLLMAIEAAQRSIYVTNPYFLPDERMSRALLAAVHRGVNVKVMVPGKIDHVYVRSASRRGFGPMIKAGVEIYEYHAALLHSKTMVIDGVWATVGSTNLDNRSFALNEELNLVVYDADIGQKFERMFADDLTRCRRITYEEWKHRSLRDRILELLTLPLKQQL
jgi:cardiolipin synthase